MLSKNFIVLEFLSYVKYRDFFQVSGPTGVGKTQFIINFINQVDILVNNNIQQIFYAIPQNHKISLKGVNKSIVVLNGLPEIDFFYKLETGKPKLLIIDDFANEKHDFVKITQLFTRGSHHTSTSIFFLTQNIFEKGLRTISLNSHYIVLFKNLRDQTQIKTIAKQIFPDKPNYLLESYKDATTRPYGYLLVDITTSCHDSLRLRSNIFKQEYPQNIIYSPTDHYTARTISMIE